MHLSYHWCKIRNVLRHLTQISERERDPCRVKKLTKANLCVIKACCLADCIKKQALVVPQVMTTTMCVATHGSHDNNQCLGKIRMCILHGSSYAWKMVWSALRLGIWWAWSTAMVKCVEMFCYIFVCHPFLRVYQDFFSFFFFFYRMDEDYSHRLKQMTKKIQGAFWSFVLVQCN